MKKCPVSNNKLRPTRKGSEAMYQLLNETILRLRSGSFNGFRLRSLSLLVIVISLVSASLRLSSASHFIVRSQDTQLWTENTEEQPIDMFDCWRKGAMNSSKDNHFILVFWQDLMASELHTNLLNRRNDSREMSIIDNDYIEKRIISFIPSDIRKMRHFNILTGAYHHN